MTFCLTESNQDARPGNVMIGVDLIFGCSFYNIQLSFGGGVHLCVWGVNSWHGVAFTLELGLWLCLPIRIWDIANKMSPSSYELPIVPYYF
jgi:hypothetical protein